MIDVTLILTGVLSLLGLILFYRLFPLIKSVIPLTLLNILKQVAKYFVYAAEAELGRGNGSSKFDMALQKTQGFLEKYRLTFDAQAVKDAILHQWLNLNMEQMASGMKR
jgi:hypothetical protein